MNDNDTIADIVQEMRHYAFPYVQQNKLIETWCARIVAAYNRSDLTAYGQRKDFTHQDSEFADKLRECNARLEADFTMFMTGRNALVEKNRKCCDENDRLREALTEMVEVTLDTYWDRYWRGCEVAKERVNEAIENAKAVLAKYSGESEVIK